MLEPPDLRDETIVAALSDAYRVDVAAVAFLPIGNDSASWAYRVEAAHGAAYFLKVRGGGRGVPGAAVPAYLSERGVPSVLAPLATTRGEPWTCLDGFALILYPAIDGRVGADVGLSAEQWRLFGSIVSRIHAVLITAELERSVRRERFVPSRRELIPALEASVAAPSPADSPARDLAAFWRSREDEIRALVRRADELGRRLERTSIRAVLCHGDLHTWNVLVDDQQALWIVDWDDATLAPKELDLVWATGGIGHGLDAGSDAARFLEGYGGTAIDPLAAAYYRYAWAVQDIAAYAEEVLMLPGRGEASRRAAVDGFITLFEPGDIVERARALDGLAGS